MSKPFDLSLIETRQAIISVINNSGLPISALSLIVKDVGLLIDKELENTLNIQVKEYYKSEEKKDSKEDLKEGDNNG